MIREALGMWLTLLRWVPRSPRRGFAKFDWPHVIAAHAGLRELEGTALKAAVKPSHPVPG